jgi:hypothetical protein
MGDIKNRTGCCDCGQLVDACTCSGVSATTQCQHKSGSAEICGIPEFADPPEHWFRRRQTTGTMSLSKFADAVCEGELPVGATLECRSKVGSGTLIGFSEFPAGPPSVPPKKYRRFTASGSNYFCPDGGCGGPSTGPGKNEYQDGYQYDAVTGSLSITGIQKNFTDPGGPGCPLNPAADTAFDPPSGLYYWAPNLGVLGSYATDTIQPAQRNWDHSGCIGTGPFAVYRFDCAVQALLEDEDTAADAIERDVGGDSWNTAGTCADHTSYQESRGAGDFTFNFRIAETRFVVASGLVSGEQYEGRITFGRRAQGSSDPFVDTGSPEIVNFTASGAGHTSDWIELPNEAGWEYNVIGVEVFGTIEELIEDTWDITEEFDSGTCLQSVEDNSQRMIDGAPDDGPFDDTPPDAYGVHVDVDTTPTIRTTAGKDECNSDGEGRYLQANGTVQEQLDQEDTDQDAATRAMSAITDWSSGGCDLPAFITQRSPGNTVFGFRWLQVRAAMNGANPTSTYQLTWRVYRRPNGTSTPYEYYGDLIQQTTAPSGAYNTDWIDVPNEAGWDTRIVGNPTVELIA